MKKTLLMLFCVVLLAAMLVALPIFAQDDITVTLNGEKLDFDVQPILMNDRTMVPMRAIFEALNVKVYWNDYTETVSAYSYEKGSLVLPIGADTATLNGKPMELDQPAVLHNDRTLVPIRFVSESLGCKVDWDDKTQTVIISKEIAETVDPTTRYYGVTDLTDIGTWAVEDGGILKGRTDTQDGEVANITETEGDAILTIDIVEDGKYKIWGLSRDFATQNQGARFFNIAIDGVRAPNRLGTHGKDGYHWAEVGTFDLTAGPHEIRIQDTSQYWARYAGLFVTKNLTMTPPSAESEYKKYHLPSEKYGAIIPASFPEWANGDVQATATETIENEKIKIVFYQGATNRGGLVQNEIYLNQNGNWTLVKARKEDLGALAMRNNDGYVSKIKPPVVNLSDTPWESTTANFDTYLGAFGMANVTDFYQMGAAEWLIPNGMTRVDDKTIQLSMTSENVDGTLTYTFDELTFEPKVTFTANIKTAGGYSFAHFTGGDFKESEFTRVTAPLMYTKDFVPETASVLAEYMMFTPMISFTFGEGGNAITKGVVVDPTCVRQDVATPGRSDFGVTFRAPNGNVRGQLLAPYFGSESSVFNAGDNYTFAYRLLYNDADWYENYTHVAQDIYNCVDLRTNYYASLNEAIYNTTDLMMDDTYGGWKDKDMGFYNMEAPEVTTISNAVTLMQRYMLTEDESILEERAVPALAFILSRGGMHFKSIEGANAYTPTAPVALGGVNSAFGPSSYLALYRMSQGRVPFLMNYSLSRLTATTDVGKVTGYAAWDDMMGKGSFKQEIVAAADEYLKQLDKDSVYYNEPYGSFIYTRDIPMMQSFLSAYEATGEQKYLDGAKEVGELIMTMLWTTGYQNDYATTDYTTTYEKVYSRPMANDDWPWYYHKDGKRWRVGNPVGVGSGVYTENRPKDNEIKEETAPGWIPSRTGFSSEHTMTPSNGNAITMNMWAGSGLRVGGYTNDDFIITQARNAMVGRFANYSGYYHERYLLHDKQKDYPYNGPDTNLIYWHHIPVFLGLLEDFLINNIWEKSEGNITFPTAVNQGYAYFVTNQYGFAAGDFYDQKDMWIWLDRGIAQPDSVEIDYLPAKKDGVLGIAFVNEGGQEKTSTITLGNKVPNAAALNTTATVYDKDGNKSTVDIVNGAFTLTIPAKGIRSVVFAADVKKPAYAQDYTPSTNMQNTVADFKSGKAYLLQFNPDNYYAYIYTPLMPTEVKSATINYTVNGQAQTKTINEYPFEAIIKVPAQFDMQFSMTITRVDGSKEELGGGTLKPADQSQMKPYKKGDDPEIIRAVSSIEPFENFNITYKSAGQDTILRIVADASASPIELKPNCFAGLKLKGILEDIPTGKKVLLETSIVGNEVRDGGVVVLRIEPTENVPMGDYWDILNPGTTLTIISPDKDFNSVKIENEEEYRKNKVSPPGSMSGVIAPSELPEFEPFKVTYTGQGTGATTLRFITPMDDYPIPVAENSLVGAKVTMKVTENDTKNTATYECIIVKNEMRTATNSVVIEFEAPPELPAKDYDNTNKKTHKFELEISNPN